MPACAGRVMGTQGPHAMLGRVWSLPPPPHGEAKQWPVSHMPRAFSPLCAKIRVQDIRVSWSSRKTRSAYMQLH